MLYGDYTTMHQRPKNPHIERSASALAALYFPQLKTPDRNVLSLKIALWKNTLYVHPLLPISNVSASGVKIAGRKISMQY